MPNTKPRKSGPRPSGEARERILAAATELFYRDGIRAVGVDAVVRESGVAKMTLYAHFKSKDELVAACLSRQGDACRERFARALEGVPEQLEPRVDAFFSALGAWFSEPDFRGCPFINATSEFGDPSHTARRLTLEHQEFLRSALLAVARMSDTPEAESIAEELLLLVEGAIVLAVTRGDATPARNAHAAARRILGLGR